MLGRRIKRTRRGEVQLNLTADERDLLRTLPGQLRELLDDVDDPDLRRLFPPAYSEHPEHEAEYRQLMGDELRQKHLASLAVMEESVGLDRLSEDQALGWLSAINDLRLVLGTRLDVSEDMLGHRVDPSDPDAPSLALYGYLSWLEEQLVEALASGL